MTPSWTAPTPEQLDRLTGHLGHAEQYRYFFDRLQNPLWLEPLQKRGFFKNPPEPFTENPEENPIHPVWPASRYLVRMAGEAPELVRDILLAMPDTANVMVQRDVIEAAQAMPPRIAGRLAPRILEWTKQLWGGTAPNFVLPELIGKLVAHLAGGSEIDSAMRIARALLELIPGPDSESAAGVASDRARAKFEGWQYSEIVRKDIPSLVEAAGIRGLSMLVKALKRALWLTRTPEERSGHDYSFLWRPAIEEHEQNLSQGDEPVHALIGAVRDAAIALAGRDTETMRNVVELLEAESDPMLTRIVLYVLATQGNKVPELVTRFLTNPDLFSSAATHHEYYLLARNQFGVLPEHEKSTVLGWVEIGPDRERIANRIQEGTGRPATQEEIDKIVRRWQLDHLEMIKDYLTAPWTNRYQSYAAEFGAPSHPDFLSYGEVRMGDESPWSAPELAAKSVPEIARVLRTWKPDQPFGPSIEGLALVLGQLTRADPRRLADGASHLKIPGPPYIRQVLHGFRDAVADGKPFDWEPVLDLCLWVIKQPRDLDPLDLQGMWDPDWGWTLGAIAHLLYVGFDAGPCEIPVELRRRVWEVLLPLTFDPDPGSGAPSDGFASTAQMLSVNTVRGEAMHDVMKYALWLRRDLERQQREQDVAAGFAVMPEVREVLDLHLDLGKEPATSIRAVYGQWFPWLLLLDPEWTKSAVDTVFPVDPGLEGYWGAAWDTYITMCPAYDSAFDVLQAKYAHAVDLLETTPEERSGRGNPADSLAEHMMAQYWRGRLTLEVGSLLNLFYSRAPDAVLEHAVSFIGRSLRHADEKPSPDVLERLQMLWEVRFTTISSIESHERELAAFGWWATPNTFDEKWILEQLKRLRDLGVEVDVPDLVVEFLATAADAHPTEAVGVLRRMIETADHWAIRRWAPEARNVLASALASSDERAASQAREVIEYLGRKGYLEFRDLVQV